MFWKGLGWLGDMLTTERWSKTRPVMFSFDLKKAQVKSKLSYLLALLQTSKSQVNENRSA